MVVWRVRVAAILLLAVLCLHAAEVNRQGTVDGVFEAALERLDELEVEYGVNLFEGKNSTGALYKLLEMAAAANLTTGRSVNMIISQLRSGRASAGALVDTWSKVMLKHTMREALRQTGAREERADEIRQAKVRPSATITPIIFSSLIKV